jgi:Copper type II ascorbate-dependent monooxygenase, N-terminal domain/Copper type II ascorbate-dependent monooxygenase, C-terminal domain
VRRRLLLLVAAAAIGAVILDVTTVHSAGAPQVRRAAVTWDGVAPLFAEKCAGCHQLGGIAPFSLTTARSAHLHAAAILAMTQENLMPPWMPGADSPAYLNQAQRILTPQEKTLIATWVRSGAKLGSAQTIKPVTQPETAPGTTITLAPRQAYKPHGIGGGTDDYHCFLLDPHLTQDSFVTAARVVPQHPNIVHHVILFDANGANGADARQLNAQSGGKGWTCFGGPGLSETQASTSTATSERLGAPQWIAAWVPGHTNDELPQGTGVLVHAGDLVVMQVHYNLLHDPGEQAVDRSSVQMRVTPAAGANLTPLDTYLLPAPVELPCPAGVTHNPLCDRTAELRDEVKKYGNDAAFIPLGLLILCHEQLQQVQGPVSTCTRTVDRPLRIYGVAGHMHLRGVDIRIDLNGKTLLHIPRWQFHWQDAYYLQQPVDANAGDALRVTCRFDNSRTRQPYVNGKPMTPRYVLWGEGTADEMCLGLLQVAAR